MRSACIFIREEKQHRALSATSFCGPISSIEWYSISDRKSILTYKNNPCAVALVTFGDTGNTPSFHRMVTRFDSYANKCIWFFSLSRLCIRATADTSQWSRALRQLEQAPRRRSTHRKIHIAFKWMSFQIFHELIYPQTYRKSIISIKFAQNAFWISVSLAFRWITLN